MKTLQAFPFFNGEKPRIFGHRGAAGVAPENTLVSFERAVGDGAGYVEMDVRESGDGELLVIHDATLERTTNGKGEVGRRTLAEIKRVDAGYWFSPDGGLTYPYRGRGIGIPTVEDFFLHFPRVRATIEIKQASLSSVKRLVATIRRLGREGAVLLAAEDDEIMREVRREIGRYDLPIATGFSYGEVATFMRGVWQGGRRAHAFPGQALQVPRFHGGLSLVTPETLRAAHDLGIEVHVWTVNDAEEMKALLDLGVDGVITDYPARLRDVAVRMAARRKEMVP